MVADLTARDVEQWRSATGDSRPTPAKTRCAAQGNGQSEHDHAAVGIELRLQTRLGGHAPRLGGREQPENTTGRRTLLRTLSNAAPSWPRVRTSRMRALVEACPLTGLPSGKSPR
jgi:hypothetical protein